jgi:hypothetical protein
MVVLVANSRCKRPQLKGKRKKKEKKRGGANKYVNLKVMDCRNVNAMGKGNELEKIEDL